MADLSLEITADVVAWYGAILATFGFGLSLVQVIRDRSRVKIEASEGFVFAGPNEKKIEQIIVKAVNAGRRPVTLQNCSLRLETGKYFVMLNPINFQFPYELQEGKSIQVLFDKRDLVLELKKESTWVTHACYNDATGRKYSTRFKFCP